MFGRMCRNTIVASPAPLATAAGTKSASRSASVSPRVIRTSPGTPAIPSATVVVVSDGPRIAARPIARITNGNASITSVTPCDDRVDPAAVVAREQADRHGDQEREPGREEADRERHARAPDQAREHVPAELVRAEEMVPRGVREHVVEVGVGLAERRDQRREDRRS